MLDVLGSPQELSRLGPMELGALDLLGEPAVFDKYQEMLPRAQSGDRVAQAWVLKQLLPQIRRISRAFSQNAAQADDAAQLALLEILKSLSTYRGEAKLESWAKRIAVRTVLRHKRREVKRDAEDYDEVQFSDPDYTDGLRTSMLLLEQLPRPLTTYLHDLPEPQATAIVLHHALGHSLEEGADLCDTSLGTFKSRLRLGLTTLRKQIQRELLIGQSHPERRPS